jgi:hypothetical protein
LGEHVGPESDKSAPTHPQEGKIGVMDDLQVSEKELRCEACGRVIKPERDEKVERVTDEDGLVRVFCELDRCRQHQSGQPSQVHQSRWYVYASRADGRSK